MMSLMRWEPFNDLVSLREAMDQLFEESVVRPRRHNGHAGVLALPLEICQTGDEVVIRALVPGVRPEDIELTVLGETVTIKGEVKEVGLENATYLMREFRYGQFARSVTLPVPFNAAAASATFEHGVLTLRIPKAESAKPRQIKVQATSK